MEYADSDPIPGTVVGPLRRTYHSNGVTGLFGRGWVSFIDAGATALRGTNQRGTVVLRLEDERRVVFDEVDGTYIQTYPPNDQHAGTLEYVSGIFRYRAGASRIIREFRSSDGRLVSTYLPEGDGVNITFDATPKPLSVADRRGRWSWTLTYDASNRISSIYPTGHPELTWTYGYSNGNLTTVTAPGNAVWRSYSYGAGGLETIADGAGHFIESHQYISGTNGVSNSLEPYERITSITTGLVGRVSGETRAHVVTADGSSTSYYRRYIAGKARTVEIEGSCSCGTDDVVFGYNTLGQAVREQDARGYITLRIFTNGRVTSIGRYYRPANCDPETDTSSCRLTPDALLAATVVPTDLTTTSTFSYADPNWPDLVTRTTVESLRAGQTREESIAYDALTGLTTSDTVIGYDPSAVTTVGISRTTTTSLYDGTEGALFDPCAGVNGTCAFESAWLTLPQPIGLPRQTDGPRADVNDLTSYVYYPFDAAVPADLRGRLAAVRNALGHETRFENYDLFGNARRVIDANGVVAETTYDAIGRLLTSTLKGVPGCDTTADALCATDLVTRRLYDDAGPLGITIGPRAEATTEEYDSWGRPTAVMRGELTGTIPSTAAAAIAAASWRERVEYEYSASTGRKVAERLFAREGSAWVEKKTTTFAYDTSGHVNTVTHADGTSIGSVYEHGLLSSMKDENHTAANTLYEYDGAGRLTEVRQTLVSASSGQIATLYAYDRNGNLASVTDPNGNVTTYVYDDFGGMVSQTSPVTGTTTYSYDASGNLTSSTDANGATTARTYDSLGRVTVASSLRPPRDPETITWSYDDAVASHFGFGRLATMSDSSGGATYRYGRRGLLASELKTIGSQTFTTAFQYDASGNRSAIRYPSGRNVTWTFDYANRPLSAAAGTTTLVSAAAYLPFGPATNIVFGNGTAQHVTYDNRYRPTTNQLNGGEVPIVSNQYHYDNAGNITGIDDQIDPSFNRTFGYDDLNRLTTANGGEGLWGAGSYSYDAMGNVRALNLGESRTVSFVYDGTTPLLTSVTENGRTRAVTYDAAGNERGIGTDTAMTYTPSNHLEHWNDITYIHDGRGVRTTTIRPVRVVNLSVNPSSVVGGNTAQATVTLSSPAPADGAVVTLISDRAAASVPASVSVAAGQTAATFTVSTITVSGETTAILTANFNGSSASGTVTVTGSRIDEVEMSPQSVVGGAQASGSIQLATPAPEQGLYLTLRSSDPKVTVPSEMSIRGGEQGAVFPVSTTPVARATTVTISIYLDEERHDTTLTVEPPSVAAFTFASRSIRGGSSVMATLTLDGTASERGITIGLETDSRLLEVPASVAVDAGQRSATFAATAKPVESDVPVSVAATLGEQRTMAELTIEPPVLTGLTVTPPTVVGGEPLTAKPVIDGPAAASGAAVAITSSDPSLVAALSGATIPAGAVTATVQLPTNPVAATTPVVVSASRQGVTRSTTVTLEPPAVTLVSITLASLSIIGTNNVMATIALTGPAPAGGVEIEMTSSNPAVAGVPPVLTVPPGTTSATLIVTTSLVTADTQVTLTALHATTLKAVPLSVLHPNGNYIAAIDVTPAFIAGGTSASGTVRLAMPSSDHGGSDVALASSNAALSVPARVKVNPNSATATFTLATSAVSGPVPVVVTAFYGGVTQRMNVMVAPANAVTLASLTIAPSRVTGGSTAMGTVTLNRPAPLGGARVTVEARRRTIVNVPSTVVVPEGASLASFSVTTDALHGAREKLAEIVATYNNVSASATLTVLPPAQAASTHRPMALCASIALVPCVTQSAVRAIKPLGGQDGDPPPSTSPTLFETQSTLYTPELTLLSETSSTSTATPVVAYDYVWFGGQPLAQIENTTGTIAWYFNDHLGTPIRQTDDLGRLVWHAEYEPYGTIYGIPRGESRHQPLRLPGQTVEEGSDLYQNIFRWYRSGWGRYTQADPIGLKGGVNLFSYVFANPLRWTDTLGLRVRVCCKPIPATLIGKRHCYFEFDDGPYLTIGYHLQNEEQATAVVGAVACQGGASVAYDHGFDTNKSNPGECGSWNECNSQCVRDRAAQYGTRQYCLLGPNSNTFASFITKGCGLTAPPQNVIDDSPGWNDLPPWRPYP
jgi:RHS repeat-associated protein